MNAGATAANCAWLATNLPAWSRFRKALHHPEATQRLLLSRLIQANAVSAFGEEFKFGEIRSYEDFRECVPISEYETFEPWIERIMRGEQGVLTAEPVTHLVPTSGSSGARKLIPFTQSLQRQFNEAIGAWMVDLCRRHPSIPLGRSYWSISPTVAARAHEDSVVPIGFDADSAYLGGVRQRLVELTFAVPSAIHLVTDLESFRYLTLLYLLRDSGLRFISIWHPSFLSLILNQFETSRDELLWDIEQGGCGRIDLLPKEIRSAINLPPMPARAREVSRVGQLNPRELWPQLQVISCWGDAQATPAFTELRQKWPNVEIQRKGLLATEAFVSIPFKGQHPLAVTSHFFEFEDARGKVYLAHQLTPGQSYTVIVTAAGGLWRYRLGDIVEVDGWLGATPSLRFLGRGASICDLCGEKLNEVFVSAAINRAFAKAGFASPFAMLAPEQNLDGNWNYTLFIEGDPPIGIEHLLEAELRENIHYNLCRDLQQLGPVALCNISSGAYEVFTRIGLASGRVLGEIKPLQLSSRTDWRSLFTQ
jgi:hypothetical protein